MESMYEDGVAERTSSFPVVSTINQADGKPRFFLDFTVGASKTGTKATNAASILRLTSPELEKFIAQSGSIVTTPTPTTQILFPKTVTEEQEAYARGFIDALEKLHQGTSVNQSSSGLPFGQISYEEVFQNLPLNPAASLATYLSSAQLRTSIPGPSSLLSCLPLAKSSPPLRWVVSTQPAATFPPSTSFLVPVKEELQTVPCLDRTPFGSQGPSSPSGNQVERLEVKRARNRLAAQKCRGRKLERISVLSERVDLLRYQNSDLFQTSVSLKNDVASLRLEIMKHVEAGCRVMVNISTSSALPCQSITSGALPALPSASSTLPNLTTGALPSRTVTTAQMNAAVTVGSLRSQLFT